MAVNTIVLSNKSGGKTKKMDNITKITSDARFRLARSLMTSSGGTDSTTDSGSSDSSLEGAIDIFASLLEKTRNTCGETSLAAALCYYEYGNALFRAVVRRQPLDGVNEKGEEEEDKKPAAKPSASAAADTVARKRSIDDDNTKAGNKRAKMENNDDEEDEIDDDDIDLALEMLTTSFSIFDWHSSDDDNTKTKPDKEGKQYSLTQIPRVLSTIGDIHSNCGKFGDAVDAYCRALTYRENAWEERHKTKGESLSVDDLKCQRLLVETYALIAEALLACKEGEDVVCKNDEDTEEKDDTNNLAAATKDGKNREEKVIVAAKDRIDFADSHYNTAREKLQDIGTCFCVLQCFLLGPSLQTTT